LVYFMKNIIWLSILIATLAAGCASAPVREGIMVYNLGGVQYLPLGPVCSLSGMGLDYDPLSQTAVLSGEKHKINIKVGEALLLVDGKAAEMKYPVLFHEGMIVVPEQFRSQIMGPLFVKERPSSKQVARVLAIKKVVIDAGHGGHDPGAIGKTGLQEKLVNLDVARRLTEILASEGIEVVMTRSTDKFIPLTKRSDIANNSLADIFVSIHSNANHSKKLNGFEVYYVSPSVDDYKRALGAVRSAPLNLEGSSLASSSTTLKMILWDMIYTSNRAQAVELSQDICSSIDYKLDTAVRGVKQARYEVLKGTRMPAVLIEIGFLSNAAEEELLKNSGYRQKMAEAIAEGVFNYARQSRIMEAAQR